jgi:thioredoxin reductase
MHSQSLPVVVIGAGPVGLAAAAHLLERGETPLVFEKGSAIAANIRDWRHVRMFSPWEFTVDSASVRLLTAHGWQMPQHDALPTGGDLVDLYLQPLAELPELKPYIHLNAQVVAITRRDVDKMKDAGRATAPFVLQVAFGDGSETCIEARAVIDASGTWHNPNPLGAGGLPALGERQHAAHIYYGIPDVLNQQRSRYANKQVLVVGSGHSAINALLELVALQESAPATMVYWAMRSTNLKRVYGGGENDGLAARGSLGTRIKQAVDAGKVEIIAPFYIRAIRTQENGLSVESDTPDGVISIGVDEIIAATGARPELNMLRELRLDVDPSLESARELAPMIDPNIHSCGTVRPHGEAELRHPEKDFYIVGMKSYGRAPTFLLATGYEQVRSVVAALVGDMEAAREVQLNLPETGVCSTDFADGEGAACCGTPAVKSEPALISLGGIPVNTVRLQPISLQMVGGQTVTATVTRDCGCDDTCCGDGIKSTTCGCDSTCCS